MGSSPKQIVILSKLPFYLLISLLIVIPLIFTENIENGFELTKAAALKIIGGLFITSAFLYLFILKRKKKELAGIFSWNKNIDPYVAFFLFAGILSTIFSIKPYVSFCVNYERQTGLLVFLYLCLIYFFPANILIT